LVVVLASVARPRVRLATVNVHAFTRTMARPVAWRATVARLSRLAGTLVAQWGRVVMGGDWNRPWQLRARFPGFGTARPPRPTTAGGRIDYLYAHGFRFARVGVIGPTYSDHDGVRAWLRRV
jgi:endonuclease/exonuclease/phosphatase (EEP) superfamily protein YafD